MKKSTSVIISLVMCAWLPLYGVICSFSLKRFQFDTNTTCREDVFTLLRSVIPFFFLSLERFNFLSSRRHRHPFHSDRWYNDLFLRVHISYALFVRFLTGTLNLNWRARRVCLKSIINNDLQTKIKLNLLGKWVQKQNEKLLYCYWLLFVTLFNY